MARNEFTKKTQRAAKDRSGGACEADGELYGLPAGVRCGADMTRTGYRYDHIDPDANSKDNSLENCCACCPRCHDHKTRTRDIPMIAKTVRQRDKNDGIRNRKSAPMIGTKASGWKRGFDGQAMRRT